MFELEHGALTGAATARSGQFESAGGGRLAPDELPPLSSCYHGAMSYVLPWRRNQGSDAKEIPATTAVSPSLYLPFGE
ncbi:MAG TPA: sigma 54-interacting transcriptional regulator [Candidatus Binatia bacterium]|nr:sigma 54-interacting transcriptional regulator [Candidatus Binatia bacterium]